MAQTRNEEATSPSEPSSTSAVGAKTVDSAALESFRHEIHDAQELLEFAVAEGRPIPDAIVYRINRIGALLEIGGTFPPPYEERAAFEKAYRDLALFMSPVTVRTLRATSDRHGRTSVCSLGLYALAEAQIWSRKLWLMTLAAVVVALFGESLDRILTDFSVDQASGESRRSWQLLLSVLHSLVPFTYGAIGACTYLLRSCHTFIHKREFDPNRIPEYYNRILLGVVSGSAILLFIQQVSTDDGTVRISAAALAFLAGYNTEFLFQTIERVAAAVLPKVGLETVGRGAPTPSTTPKRPATRSWVPRRETSRGARPRKREAARVAVGSGGQAPSTIGAASSLAASGSLGRV